MQASAVRLSIEALYQEAEAVVHDETPMLAIIKSFPPVDNTGANLSLVSDATGNEKADQAILHRIDDLLAEAESIAGQPEETATTSVAHPVGAQTEDTRAEDTRAEDARAEDAQFTDQNQTDDIKLVDNEALLPLGETAADHLPATPPIPNEIAGANQLDGIELDQLLQDAKADIDAMAPATPSSPREMTSDRQAADDTIQETDNIETVMADIAAAVGVTTEISEPVPTTDMINDDLSQGAAESKSTQSQTVTINAELSSFIGDIVRSVLSEELPVMVRAALKDALGDMTISSPTRKAKTAPKTKTSTKTRPATKGKTASTQKTAVKKKAGTKAAAGKTAAKKKTGKKTKTESAGPQD